MSIQKRLIAFFVLCCLLFLLGARDNSCQAITTKETLDKHYYSFITKDEMDQKGLIRKIDSYDTDVSVLKTNLV